MIAALNPKPDARATVRKLPTPRELTATSLALDAGGSMPGAAALMTLKDAGAVALANERADAVRHASMAGTRLAGLSVSQPAANSGERNTTAPASPSAETNCR
jgi:hypothetical protein